MKIYSRRCLKKQQFEKVINIAHKRVLVNFWLLPPNNQHGVEKYHLILIFLFFCARTLQKYVQLLGSSFCIKKFFIALIFRDYSSSKSIYFSNSIYRRFCFPDCTLILHCYLAPHFLSNKLTLVKIALLQPI